MIAFLGNSSRSAALAGNRYVGRVGVFGPDGAAPGRRR
jgi:hypothetical protein